jgi:hypothetical protein
VLCNNNTPLTESKVRPAAAAKIDHTQVGKNIDPHLGTIKSMQEKINSVKGNLFFLLLLLQLLLSKTLNHNTNFDDYFVHPTNLQSLLSLSMERASSLLARRRIESTEKKMR